MKSANNHKNMGLATLQLLLGKTNQKCFLKIKGKMFNTNTFLCFYVSYPLQDRSNFLVCGCTPVVLPIK